MKNLFKIYGTVDWKEKLPKYKIIVRFGQPGPHSVPFFEGTIDPWCEKNCQGKFLILNETQYFEYKEDLVAFVLRWGE